MFDAEISDTDITPYSAHSNEFIINDPDAYAEPLYNCWNEVSERKTTP